jgi:hypothetical protein
VRRSPYKPSTGWEIRGSHVIVAIFVLAIAGAGFAWAFRYYRSRNILALWGPEAAQLFRDQADEIWLDTLKPTDAEVVTQPTLAVDGRKLEIIKSQNIAGARGILNVRQALIERPSFAWGKPRGDCRPRWEYALVFVSSESGHKATLVVDTLCGRIKLLETGKEIALTDRIAQALNDFVREQLKPQQPPAASGAPPA